MPLPDQTPPEERVRHIEEETEHLGRQMSRAAEAAHRALAADSLAGPSENYGDERRPRGNDHEGEEPGPESDGEPGTAKRKRKRKEKA